MSKTIVFKRLKYKLLDLRWVKKINETELSFQLKNNSTISLKGADNYDSLRGVGLSGLIIDEAADVDQAAWLEVLRPALSDRQGSAMFLGTPKGFNWFKDLFDLAEQFPDEWRSFQYTTLDGGQVPEKEIEAARRVLDERQFQQEYMATFQNFTGRVFYAFDRSYNIKKFSEEVPKDVHIGMDFNVDNNSAVIFAKHNDVLHAIDEIRLMGSNTDEMVDEIKTRYPNRNITVYPDPSGSQRRTSSSGRTDHTILRAAGFRVLAPRSHDSVRDSVNAVNARLRSSLGLTTLYFDPRCKYTIESIEKFVYKPNSSIPDKDSGFDHMCDALRYAVNYLFPIRAEQKPIPVGMWSHKLG
jgi:phage terminase large subunit